MFSEERMQRFRSPAEREINIAQWTLLVATAVCAAVTASDYIDRDMAGALGNFGLLAILARMYLTMPRTIAIAKKGSADWIRAETEYLQQKFPFYVILGKLGWFALLASVIMQFSAIMPR